MALGHSHTENLIDSKPKLSNERIRNNNQLNGKSVEQMEEPNTTLSRAITFFRSTGTMGSQDSERADNDDIRQTVSDDEGSSKPRLHRRRSDIKSQRKSMERRPSLPESSSDRLILTKTWQALRAGIRLKAFKKSHESDIVNKTRTGVDLITELQMGILPALLVKLCLERDEHGNMRIPVLLNNLKLRFTDFSSLGERQHATFRIELDYGDGTMKWVIERELRDFVKLHARYKLTFFKKGLHDILPKFPIASFPAIGYLMPDLGGNTGTKTDISPSMTEKTEKDQQSPEISQGDQTNVDKVAETKNTKMPTLIRKSTFGPSRKAEFARHQREVMENYLIRLIRVMMYRPEANRLCHFLELSALGVALAPEGGYQGKEGYLIIRYRSDKFSSTCTLRGLWNRYSPKWFLVRQSYVLCVDSPDQTIIHDVILADTSFEVIMHGKLRTALQDPSLSLDQDSSFLQRSFYLKNSERRLKLLAKHERQMEQFIYSMLKMKNETSWTKPNRFDSFAPVRMNVVANWLVDGRDYFWNISRAIAMAKEVIYIHDWWLSPELYMRRPPALHEDWRLDKLLKMKAEQGVKIYVILYKEFGSTVPIDSTYTKITLLNLHPNIYVQRSPDHLRTGTLFWAHHEKICCIDNVIAFVGGIDMCFGRWDTSTHILMDDKPERIEPLGTLADLEKLRMWPGKDYSNPRVMDFHTLNKPDVDLYNRAKVPRMPWHDVGLQLLGQPARDLARHFIQRWNFLLRNKNSSRPAPFLVPPADFTPIQLANLGFTGTCEVQILRSASPWSLGTPDLIEKSIQNAYLKCIEKSLHFVYIENQFFITSTVLDNGLIVENNIGNALVERIKRAYREDTPWRAIIMLPLVPGFEFPIDHADATSIRLIMHAQYRSICRGNASIFSRLRAEGIEPSDYICFYSTRNWGKLKEGQFVTEQSYIHSKTMIVDDRVAIIGSANINERSQRGNRDSEAAAIVRDTDMIETRMAGQVFEVGRFAHALRLRLMSEHIGLNVDEIDKNMQTSKSEREALNNKIGAMPKMKQADRHPHVSEIVRRFGEGPISTSDDFNSSNDTAFSKEHQQVVETKSPNEATHKNTEIASEARRATFEANLANGAKSVPIRIDTDLSRSFRQPYEADSAVTDNHFMSPQTGLEGRCRSESNVSLVSNRSSVTGRDRRSRRRRTGVRPIPNPPEFTANDLIDPLDDNFYESIWHAIALSNTEIFRRVFRCIPDDLVTTWKDYKDYMAAAQVLNSSTASSTASNHKDPNSPLGRNANDDKTKELIVVPGSPTLVLGTVENPIQLPDSKEKTIESSQAAVVSIGETEPPRVDAQQPTNFQRKGVVDHGFLIERTEMVELLRKVRGTLVIWPTRFLEQEDLRKLFLFSVDQLHPQDLYI